MRSETRAGSDVDLCISLDSPNPFSLAYFQQEAELQLGMHAAVVTRWLGVNPALKEEIERAVIFI